MTSPNQDTSEVRFCEECGSVIMRTTVRYFSDEGQLVVESEEFCLCPTENERV